MSEQAYTSRPGLYKERAKQHRIGHAEDGGARPDAQRQREYGRGGECRAGA